MSAPTTVGVEHTGTAKRMLAIASLVTALVAGIFAAYVLTTGTPAADTAPASTTIERTHSGAGSCTGAQVAGGGFVEGLSPANACGAPGGTAVSGGLQP